MTAQHVITLHQLSDPPKEYCPSKFTTGRWWWNLNDGNLPVGPFVDELDACGDAIHALRNYRDAMGGRVDAVTITIRSIAGDHSLELV
jgi:hypothetical protein